ncbi:hypothetical protein [Streptomyces platensis]|uniref:hypothetical protein n=1 Tax=Streptomyces platensis TaxID=58346 RepID=UPI0038646851
MRPRGSAVVLKPAAHAAGIGVIRVDAPGQIAAAYGFADRATGLGPESVLVEEYL